MRELLFGPRGFVLGLFIMMLFLPTLCMLAPIIDADDPGLEFRKFLGTEARDPLVMVVTPKTLSRAGLTYEFVKGREAGDTADMWLDPGTVCVVHDEPLIAGLLPGPTTRGSMYTRHMQVTCNGTEGWVSVHDLTTLGMYEYLIDKGE